LVDEYLGYTLIAAYLFYVWKLVRSEVEESPREFEDIYLLNLIQACHPVFLMPAAIPLMVNNAPRNNSLRLYVREL
jgi:hypothetical protein